VILLVNLLLKAVVPELVRTVTQIKVAIMSYYPPKIFSHFMSKISFAVIAHNIEQGWPTRRSRSTGRSPSVSCSIAPDFALN